MVLTIMIPKTSEERRGGGRWPLG